MLVCSEDHCDNEVKFKNGRCRSCAMKEVHSRKSVRDKISKANSGSNNGMYGKKAWNSGSIKENDQRLRKVGNRNKRSKETKQKIRESVRKAIHEGRLKISGGYNPDSIRHIEKYAKAHDLNITHAENGGE